MSDDESKRIIAQEQIKVEYLQKEIKQLFSALQDTQHDLIKKGEELKTLYYTSENLEKQLKVLDRDVLTYSAKLEDQIKNLQEKVNEEFKRLQKIKDSENSASTAMYGFLTTSFQLGIYILVGIITIIGVLYNMGVITTRGP